MNLLLRYIVFIIDQLPYERAKEMLLVDNLENREFLRDLLAAMYDELPAPRKRK